MSDQGKRLLKQLEQLEHAGGDNVSQCEKLLLDLKLEIINYNILPPFNSPKASEELQVARDGFECAVFVSTRKRDFEAFERHFAQLRPFYFDYQALIPPSKNMWSIIGLNLTGLLAHNRIAEFHTELEIIPVESHKSQPAVAYAIRLEQYMMEGNYSKLLDEAQRNKPTPYFNFFADILVNTVRTKISDCAEKAYSSLSLQDLCKLLTLANEKEGIAFAKSRNWRISDNVVDFDDTSNKKLTVPARQLIKESLLYAHELERIV